MINTQSAVVGFTDGVTHGPGFDSVDVWPRLATAGMFIYNIFILYISGRP